MGIILSGVISWIVSAYTSKRKIKSKYNDKLFDLYNKMCRDIIEIILPLTDISLQYSKETISDERLLDIKNKLSDAFYKYYNFLPEKVLLSIICLHTCLKDKDKTPHRYKKQRKRYIITPCKTTKEWYRLLARTTITNYIKRRNDLQFSHRILKSYKYAKEGSFGCKERLLHFYKSYTLKTPMNRKYKQGFILNIQARYM